MFWDILWTKILIKKSQNMDKKIYRLIKNIDKLKIQIETKYRQLKITEPKPNPKLKLNW